MRPARDRRSGALAPPARARSYLRIAGYLSPPLGQVLGSAGGSASGAPSLTAAAQVLSPGEGGGGGGEQGQLRAEVQRQLLTTLLDLANGAIDWSQCSAAVQGADGALASGSTSALRAAVKALDVVTFANPGNH